MIDTEGVRSRAALPANQCAGGGDELVIHDAATQVEIEFQIAVDPPF